MSKILKKILFWLFIILVIVVIAYLSYLAYIDANCTRGMNYLISKYEIKSDELKSLKYQEYVYEDIANCNSLWLKKCTSEENLLYEYFFETEDKIKIIVKEYKDGIFEDDYVTGEIRDDYLDTNNKEEHSNSIEDFMKE